MAELASEAWGGGAFPVSQPFGYYNEQLAGWYQYAASLGWPAGTHVGIDVAMPRDTKIYAVEAGKVLESGFSDSFRPYPVIVEEDDGDIAIYGHLWSNVVRPEQRVKAGQFIGRSGEQTIKGTMTPDGSGPHLHYELRRPDPTTGGYVAVDPVPELTGASDGFDPGGAYEKELGLGFDAVDAETAGPGLKRVMFFAAGLVVALVGLWAVAGAPLPPQAALIRRMAR